MDELRDMHSVNNSIDYIKELYRKAVIENYRERMKTLDRGVSRREIEMAKLGFENAMYSVAEECTLGSNARWGIVSRKNVFGLIADLYPTRERNKSENKLHLRVCSGRFQMQKFGDAGLYPSIFPKGKNVTDMLGRSGEEQFSELLEFYNMNHRELFETYGVYASVEERSCEANLVANCLLLDSLLQGRYSEVKDVFCYSPGGYVIKVELEDGTGIYASSNGRTADADAKKKGLVIRRDGKEATVEFDTKSTGELEDTITSLDDLKVENVRYTGDPELIEQLKKAMDEQFGERARDNDKSKIAEQVEKEEAVEPDAKKSITISFDTKGIITEEELRKRIIEGKITIEEIASYMIPPKEKGNEHEAVHGGPGEGHSRN